MTDSISEIQAARKRAESEPRDWPTYRDAIVASGMVREAQERRESKTLDDKLDAYRGYSSEIWLRQVWSVGEIQARIEGKL